MLELSRQKKQSTIQEISYTTCPYCKGSGLRPSLEYASLGAFRKIESEVVKGIYSELRVILPHEIASYILNHKRSELIKLESTFDLIIHISGSTEMPWDKLELHHTIKEIKEQVSDQPAPPAETVLTTEENDEPVSEENTSATPVDAPKKKSRRRRHKKRKPMETQPEGASPDDMPPAMPAPESEVKQDSLMPESIPLVISVPLIVEPAEQDQSQQKAPLLIEPAKPAEDALVPQTHDTHTDVIETEKKEENI
jgi:ribonuclease E